MQSDFDRFQELAAQTFNIEKDEATREKVLADLGADSLDLLEFVMALEDGFHIEIDDADMDRMLTLGDCFGVVEKKQSARRA